MRTFRFVPFLLLSSLGGLAACDAYDDAEPSDDELAALDEGADADADADALDELRSATVDFGQGPVEVTYEVVDGQAVMEGDIVLGPVALVDRGELVFEAPGDEPIEGVLPSGLSHLNAWPGGRIPFVMDAATFPAGSARRATVQAAIDHWNANTLVRLVPHQDGVIEHFVRISDKSSSMGDNEGSAAIGFQPGTDQRIRLGANVSTATVIHEIGHTVGLFHEQSRTDRDDFVLINFDQIQPGKEHNFNSYLVDGFIGLDFGPYDLGSIMHYGSFTFARDTSEPTIVRKISGCTATSLDAACRINPPATLSALDRKGVTRQVSGDPLGKFRLRNEASGTCLRPSGGSAAVGAAVVLDSCSNTASRRWYEYRMPGVSAPMYVNEHSRLCLAANANNQMVQVQCNGATAHRFVTADADGLFNGDFIKRSTSCLTRVDGSTRPVLSTSCANVASKRWFKDLF